MRKPTNKKGQSVAEYAILFAMVTAGFMAVQHFIVRCVEGRIQQVTDEASEPIVDEGGNPYFHTRGQCALDYLALLIAATTVILMFGARLQPKLQSAFNSMGDKIVNEIGR